jgi:glycosyltransferase involved in cell wall biosynthesis
MKVALISYGPADYSVSLANGLARECDVMLMLPRGEAMEHQASLAPTVQFYSFDKPRLRQPIRQLQSIRQLLKKIRSFRPDVIHYQHCHMWFNLALPLLRSYPVVITIHDPRHHAGDLESRRTPQWLMDFGYRRASRVIVLGEALKQQVSALFDIAAVKVHVIPHVAIGSETAPLATKDDGRIILFFGRIWDYKGLKYLIEAEPLISRAIPDVRIVIAGEGDDFESYRRLMARPDRFEVHNRFITTSHRDELFREASVVALPYTEATQSGVIPVAYSFAKPVVATRVGALAEAVEDGITGRLVPPADAKALAAAIVELLQDPDRRHAMGAAGRRKLDREWSPQAVAQQSIEVYRRAIRDRQSIEQRAGNADRIALEANQY